MSGLDINVDIDDKAVRAGFDKAPSVMEKHIGRGLDRAGQEVAREMRSAAPKAFSTLAQSIRAIFVSPFERRVAPSADYAPYVEKGTGPGGSPGFSQLYSWIKTKGIQPRSPGIKSQEDLAHVLARMIPLKGTRAQPYVEPTAAKMESRVFQLVRAGVASGLAEVGGR